MKFIPIDKMAKLREASHNGDEKAKAILQAQLKGEDFDLDSYFNQQPVQTVEAPTGATTEKTANSGYGLKKEHEKTGLEKFLEFNGITKESPDYQSYVDDYYKENPTEKPVENGLGEEQHKEHCVFDDLITDEVEAIESYDKAIIDFMSDDDIGDAERKGIISELEDIKREEVKHLETLKRMKSSRTKKEEKIEGTVE